MTPASPTWPLRSPRSRARGRSSPSSSTASPTRAATACPRMGLVDQRERLLAWADGKGEAGLRDYRAERNHESIDGLPGY